MPLTLLMLTECMQNNMFEKLKDKGNFRICYLGGSITEGAGASDKTRRWSTQITAHLNSLGIENTVFEEINVGIGGTDSVYGMARLSRDVLTFAPDAVFIDFSLNDADLDDKTSTDSYEGIIRKLASIPSAPYVICIGVVPNREQEFKTELHKKIAAHYGLTYIDVKAAIDKEFGKAEPGVNTARDMLFRPDNVHPVEAGYDFYTKVIKSELSEESFKRPCDVEPINPTFQTKSLVFTDALTFAQKGNWRSSCGVSWSSPNPGRKGVFAASDDTDAELSFEFSGDVLLLGCRLDRLAGKLESELDGVKRVHDLCYATDDQPVIILSENSLGKGKHKLLLRPICGEVKIDFAAVSE